MGFILVCAVLGCGKGKQTDFSPADLIAKLKDNNPKMRYWAARELGKQPGPDVPSAVASLTEALADPDEVVRMGAAYALGDIGPPAKSALPALQKAARDPSNQVRDGVTYAVKRIRAKS
jgi:HEAT repeat protein